jgi:hypothetical protein
MTATTTSAFESARDFAEHGLRVLPVHTAIDGRCSCGKGACDSPGKHPRTANGLKDASADERALLTWNDRWPGANWALACGAHVSVIDIDSKAGADPSEIIPDYELEDRPTVWTGEALEGDLVGTRGAHVYCAPGTRTGLTGAAGVEVRGDGAYVLLPGSRHVSGVAYEWRNGARPWDVELQPVPEALVPRRAEKTAAAAPRDPDDRVPHGGRHNHLKDLAVWLVRAGVTSERVILAHLLTHFEVTCEPDPPREPGRVEKLASWAAGSDIAERERRREHAKVSAKAALIEASQILGMRPDDPLIHAWRESEHQGTPLSARTESGITIRWERQRDMLKGDDLLFPVLAVTGLPGPEKPLTKKEAMAAYKHLVTACETFGKIDMRDEAYGWLDGFERIAIEIEGRLDDPASKFLAVLDWHEYRPDPDADGQPVERWRAPLILTDLDTGDRYLGVQDLADHLRKDRRITVEYAVLTARMGEIGWARQELQAWEPDLPRADARKARVMTYRWRGGSR